MKQQRGNIRRRKQVARRKAMLLTGAAVLMIIGVVLFGNEFSSAQTNVQASSNENKYYKSIQIQEDDTLWTIAQEYGANLSAKATQDYIDELMELNHLESETIYQGQHLMVAYYE